MKIWDAAGEDHSAMALAIDRRRVPGLQSASLREGTWPDKNMNEKKLKSPAISPFPEEMLLGKWVHA